MSATPMRLVIVVLAWFGTIALGGAVALTALGVKVPNEAWLIVTNAATAIGALLANPRSGADTRSSDSQTIPIESVDSIKVDETPLRKKSS